MKRRLKKIKVEDNVEDKVEAKAEDKMTSVERRIKEKLDFKKKKQEAFLAKEALKDLK